MAFGSTDLGAPVKVLKKKGERQCLVMGRLGKAGFSCEYRTETDRAYSLTRPGLSGTTPPCFTVMILQDYPADRVAQVGQHPADCMALPVGNGAKGSALIPVVEVFWGKAS